MKRQNGQREHKITLEPPLNALQTALVMIFSQFFNNNNNKNKNKNNNYNSNSNSNNNINNISNNFNNNIGLDFWTGDFSGAGSLVSMYSHQHETVCPPLRDPLYQQWLQVSLEKPAINAASCLRQASSLFNSKFMWWLINMYGWKSANLYVIV